MYTNSITNPLKILHVASHNCVRAGGSIQMMRLALCLKEMGHDVCCAFDIKNGDNPPGLGTFGPFHAAGIDVLSFPMQGIKKFQGMLRFRKLLALQKFNVVHAHRIRALNFVLRASIAMEIPVVIGNKKNSFHVTRKQAKIYGNKKIDRIIVNANLIKHQLLDAGTVSPDKIEIIYNGVDLNAFHPGVNGNPVRENCKIERTAPVFGTIANFARKKSHNVFFDAALKVLQVMPEVKFLLVGDGNYRIYQSRMIDRGFGNNFIFTGFRTDIPEIIASLDFAVISSKKGEGLTGSLVEAMAMAKPVISTSVAGNADFIKHMETGLLVPPGDVDAMAEAMLFYLRNRKEGEKMGEHSCAFVTDKVDNKKRSKCFENLYYEILTSKRDKNI